MALGALMTLTAVIIFTYLVAFRYRVETKRQRAPMDETIFAEAPMLGNKADVKPGNASDVLPNKDAPVNLPVEPVIWTDTKSYEAGELVSVDGGPEVPIEYVIPKPKRRRRNKRGRPRMSKAEKKVAAKARAEGKKAAPKAKTAALSAKKEVKTAVMSQMSPSVAKKVDEFQPREGTIKKRLLIALVSANNKPVREADLQMSLYGSITQPSKSALGMVLKGVAANIAKFKLKYTLERVKNSDGETAIVLKAK
jgi:hypothetical protein